MLEILCSYFNLNLELLISVTKVIKRLDLLGTLSAVNDMYFIKGNTVKETNVIRESTLPGS